MIVGIALGSGGTRSRGDVGGHLGLWDLGIVVEFPPNSTILIPSSLIVHSNTPIQSDKVRYSIVQYATGHLFR